MTQAMGITPGCTVIGYTYPLRVRLAWKQQPHQVFGTEPSLLHRQSLQQLPSTASTLHMPRMRLTPYAQTHTQGKLGRLCSAAWGARLLEPIQTSPVSLPLLAVSVTSSSLHNMVYTTKVLAL